MHFIAMLRYLTRVENRKTAHAVVVIMRTVIRAFPFQEPSCALQAGHHSTRLKGKSLRFEVGITVWKTMCFGIVDIMVIPH